MRRNVVQAVPKFLPFFSFIVPFTILYFLYPNTFEPVWTGTWENRVGYLLFLWLFFLETALAWDDLNIKERKLSFIKTGALITAVALPTIYVIVANYFRLNQAIVDLSLKYNIKHEWAILMPMSIEYVVFACFFVAIVTLKYGGCAIKFYSVSTSFLLIIGIVYTINNLYPLGEFAPFQVLAIPTAIITEKVLNLIGYKTTLYIKGNVPYLLAVNPENPVERFGAGIDWPCAGVESLVVYTVTILLFLKKSGFSLKLKTFYFLLGATVTFFINVLRIVSIYVIAIHGGAWGVFHDYFGPLYSVVWIVSYPLIIIKGRSLWNKFQVWKEGST
ncbi:MAG: exosortase/archaeosortase family protein [Candidatus Bathyarchaeia archaeon]